MAEVTYDHCSEVVIGMLMEVLSWKVSLLKEVICGMMVDLLKSSMKASSLDSMRFPELLETGMYVCKRRKNARRSSRLLIFRSIVFVLEH